MQEHSTQRYYTYTSHKQLIKKTNKQTNAKNKTRKQIHKTTKQLPQKPLHVLWTMFLSSTQCYPNRFPFWIINHQQNSCWALDCFLSILKRQKQSSTWRYNLCNLSPEACTRQGWKKKKSRFLCIATLLNLSSSNWTPSSSFRQGIVPAC